MKEANNTFKGFDPKLFGFLKNLNKNNNVEWFHNHKDDYHKYLVTPAKQFITELSPFLNRLNPAIRSEPKFNETIMRLNKDMRFNKGEPYRTFLLIHFGRFKLDSEFYLYFDTNGTELGLFINNTNKKNLFFKENLNKYKNNIIEICRNRKIDNNYQLSDLNKDMDVVEKEFIASQHLDIMANIEYILLQMKKPPTTKSISSLLIVNKMIQMILQLYPLYCFAISPQPLKLIEKFENEFGELV